MKYIFAIINTFLITTIAYFCVDIAYTKLTPDTVFWEKQPLGSDPEISKTQEIQTFGRDKLAIIIDRNLFGAELGTANQAKTVKKTELNPAIELKPTSLNLKLWGTVTGGSDFFAVIEDKKSRKQSLYEIGDSIDGAIIKMIVRDKVILSHNGKDQILEIEADTKNGVRSQTIIKSPPSNDPEPIYISPQESIDDSPNLTSQIKFRPHFSNGKPDGLMLYGIKSSSIFSKIGLRNGDIIQLINEAPIVSKDDAAVLFSEIEQADNLQLTLLRRGKVEKLSFHNQ